MSPTIAKEPKGKDKYKNKNQIREHKMTQLTF